MPGLVKPKFRRSLNAPPMTLIQYETGSTRTKEPRWTSRVLKDNQKAADVMTRRKVPSRGHTSGVAAGDGTACTPQEQRPSLSESTKRTLVEETGAESPSHRVGSRRGQFVPLVCNRKWTSAGRGALAEPVLTPVKAH